MPTKSSSTESLTWLQRNYIQYAEYHDNDANKLVHEIFVPLIVATALVFLTYAPVDVSHLGLGVSNSDLSFLPVPVDAALVVFAMYSLFYLFLSPALGVLATALLFGMLYGVHYLLRTFDTTQVLYAAIALHVVSWLFQFYSHAVYEKRAPALLDNLFQALFVAPLFVLMQILMGMGFLKDFKTQITPHVKERIAKFKAAQAKKE